ncbi:unnamed protein product [Rhizoctonia solani]|uniref:HMG box domain-containing protein n=1 Tax=Rhizoctonia solani TaxID=456999 RepID=A0A8H3CLQ9_9AGAM|nr:unnamed protein product [Rhizoctonia solani]
MDAPTPIHSLSPSESSNFPSPTGSALSPFFLDAPTPASPTPEPAAKKSHGRKRPPGYIPRPRNAFILFRSHYVAAQLIPGKVENDHRHISKIIGEIWNKLAPTERLIWEQKADIEKARHSRQYPGYRYKPAKLDGVVKRRVKCRGAPALPAYSTIPGIGKSNGAHEIIGSLNADEGGELRFGSGQGPQLIDQEQRRRDKARCARVAQLVQQGIVGEKLELEAQRLGLDRESVASPTPQLRPSVHDPPGRRSQFHTNVDILRALQEDNAPAFSNPFAPNNPPIPRQDNIIPLDSIVTSSALSSYCSPAQTHTSLSPESEDNSAPPIITSARFGTDDTLHGWPQRRASSVPLATSTVSFPPSDEQFRLVVPPVQQPGTAPTTPMLTRPPSLSSLQRQHCLYYPYPRHERTQKKQLNSDLDSDSDMPVFDYVSYHSPANSPPEQYLSPHVYPRLQLDSASRHSEIKGHTSHSSTPSPLYGIDSAHSRRAHDPIDLSAMYDEQDTATGHEDTLHSTYAINAGGAYSPVPATPASLSDAPASKQPALKCKPLPNHATRPDLDAGSSPNPTYYGWQRPFGSEINYHQGAEYDVSARAATYEEIPHTYYSNDTGNPTY